MLDRSSTKLFLIESIPVKINVSKKVKEIEDTLVVNQVFLSVSGELTPGKFPPGEFLPKHYLKLIKLRLGIGLFSLREFFVGNYPRDIKPQIESLWKVLDLAVSSK